MSLEKCRQKTTDSNIKCEEKGKKAIFRNPERREYYKTQVDGCLIKDEVASDWVVSRPQIGDVIVELKGKDVDHAVTQIQATAKYWTEKALLEGKLAGLVVATQYPRIDTKIQRAATALARSFNAPLHVVTKNYEFEIENVLSFKGPHSK